MIRQVRELHIRREARARYQVDGALFTLSGDAILPNLRAARALAATMTAARRAAGEPDPVVAPGSLNAMGLIDEILHAVVAIYREHEDPEAIDDALNHLDEVLGAAAVDDVLVRFTTDYPPLAVHQSGLTPEGYLAG
ncbi:MAG TPA: alpha-amylase, partial [Patescibacteria group bacterium]|nr:alpha-amylase [Patescibacteria group bacterium]